MKTFIAVIFSLLSSIGFSSLQPQYASSTSGEATLKFAGDVVFTATEADKLAVANQQIDSQLWHLIGTMARSRFASVPRLDHKLSDIKIEAVGANRFRASYRYEGTIVVALGAPTSYELIAPIDPATIYEASAVLAGNAKRFPCTDAHHADLGSFWYFWSPYRPGCRLREGVHFKKFVGQIQHRANTVETYPEYARLADSSGTISFHLFFGMNEAKGPMNPMQSNDVNAPNYRAVRASLAQMGFQGGAWSAQKIAAYLKAKPTVYPFVEEYSRKTKRADVTVRLFFGSTGLHEGSSAFHHFLKDALATGSLVLYNGHSGMGGHLSLSEIGKLENYVIAPAKDRYQILYFNSCSSYPYYTSQYFGAKVTTEDPRGIRNLDILTNGLETFFAVMGRTSDVVLRSVMQWTESGRGPSYQTIARTIDSRNLFGVNGDEDNPTTP